MENTNEDKEIIQTPITEQNIAPEGKMNELGVVKRPAHRPSSYTKELAEKICLRICEGESLKQICKDKDMPSRSTVHKWLLEDDKKEFSDKYEFSCNVRTENMFDELQEIADDSTNDYMEKESDDGSTYEVLNSENIQRSRLRVDVRKWYLSKVLPKKYGDKIDHTSGGEKIGGTFNVIFDDGRKT
jgi:hypothetical protein